MATRSNVLAWRIPRQRSLVGYSPWGCKELDTTELLNYQEIYVYTEIEIQEFPGGPLLKTLSFQGRGPSPQSPRLVTQPEQKRTTKNPEHRIRNGNIYVDMCMSGSSGRFHRLGLRSHCGL